MESSPLTEIGLPIALAIIMVGIGLSLTVGDFRREARAPRGLVVGSLAQLLLMPALGFAVVAVLGLDPVVAVGLIIVAACPGGATSNLITYLGRANVALSIVLTCTASLVTIVTLPLFADLAIGRYLGGAGAIEVPLGRTILTLIGVVLVPVVIGMNVRARAPERAAAGERVVSALGAVILVALIVGIALSVDDLGALLRQAGPAAALLNLGGIAIGFGVGRLSGLGWEDRFTTAVELGVKNSTLGIVLGSLLGDPAFAVPSAVYGLLMYVSAAALIAVGRRRAATVVAPEPV